MTERLEPPEKWAHLQYHWIRDPHGRSIIYEWSADANLWLRTGDEQDYEPDSFVDGWTYWKPCDPAAVTLDPADEALVELIAAAIANRRAGRRGAPAVSNVLTLIKSISGGKPYDEVMDDAQAVIAAISKVRGT